VGNSFLFCIRSSGNTIRKQCPFNGTLCTDRVVLPRSSKEKKKEKGKEKKSYNKIALNTVPPDEKFMLQLKSLPHP